MHRLLELMSIIEAQDGEPLLSQEDVDLNELGDYAIQMLSDLASAAESLQLKDESLKLEDLTLPMALWIARHGGRLITLSPVINALARLANKLYEPATLAQLYLLSGELQLAFDRAVQPDQERANPTRPWRLLLMNRAIIATRSYRTELIEEAYEQLIEALPEEAPRFFEEGMQQMELLDYPPVVRQVVEKFYNMWSLPHTLH